jgi:Arm DNA-binding domain
VTIRSRRGGYQVIVYAGIDPITGRQRQIARQVKGKREAERLEAKLRAEVAAGRHRGTGARTVGERGERQEHGRGCQLARGQG